MVTYLISQQASTWNIHRYAEQVTEVAAHISSEAEALGLVLPLADFDSPAKVLRISSAGVGNVLATFERSSLHPN